jgi:hypothetical protein
VRIGGAFKGVLLRDALVALTYGATIATNDLVTNGTRSISNPTKVDAHLRRFGWRDASRSIPSGEQDAQDHQH